MKLRLQGAILVTLIPALSCRGDDEASAEASKPAEPPPALVATQVIGNDTIQQKWSYLGEVRAQSRADVAAGASGAVTRITVRAGDRIKRGQLLLEVDSALAAARHEVTEAEAARSEELLAQSRRDLERVSSLGEGTISAAEVERARSAVTTLQSELKARIAAAREAKAEYLRHLVRAPFDGVVARRVADLGDWVTPGEPVLELVSSGDVDVLVSVGASLLSGISIDDRVELVGRERAGGQVVALVPALDPVARTARVRVAPNKPAPWLLPGSSVDVIFEIAAEQDGVVVSRDAVIEAQTGARVVEVVDGVARNVPVRILARSGDSFLVAGEGLEVGDSVVVRGNERLRPGQSVSVADGSSSASGGVSEVTEKLAAPARAPEMPDSVAVPKKSAPENARGG